MTLARINKNENPNPFESIAHYDEKYDTQYWLGRELMMILGYRKWSIFCEVIEKAKNAYEKGISDLESECNMKGRKRFSSGSIEKHIQKRSIESTGEEQYDYKLSRLGCYLVAMNGDSRIPEIAASQVFFAFKTFQMDAIDSVTPLAGQILDRSENKYIRYSYTKSRLVIPGFRIVSNSHFNEYDFANAIKSIQEECMDTGKEAFFRKHFFSDTWRKQIPKWHLTEEGFSLFITKYKLPDDFVFQVLEEFNVQKEKLEEYFTRHVLSSPLIQHCLYIIRHPLTGFVKIGITKDIESRLSQLSHANGVHLEVLKVMNTPKARAIETYLHRKYRSEQQVGEWFTVNPDLILDELDRIEYLN